MHWDREAVWRLASEQPDLQTIIGQQPDSWIMAG